MNVKQAIAEIGRQRVDQQVAVLVNGKLYGVLPTLDEVTIGNKNYAALEVDLTNCLGTPEEDDSSIFEARRVIKFSNSERAMSDARNGHYVVLDDDLDFEPGVHCLSVMTYDDEFAGGAVFIVHAYTEAADSNHDIEYNGSNWVEGECYTFAVATDLEACADLFQFCGLTSVRG